MSYCPYYGLTIYNMIITEDNDIYCYMQLKDQTSIPKNVFIYILILPIDFIVLDII